MTKIKSVSVIIPSYNEEGATELLYSRIKKNTDQLNYPAEIIFINDGSKDKTGEVLDKIASKDSSVKVIHFARNYGQTAAMMAGIDYAQGDVIVAMDGDGQNDPNDIEKLLTKIEEGYDVVSGWRKDRQDKSLTRKLPSFFANKLISWVSGVKLRDYGCSLKAYRRDIIKHVRLYGEMHRFIPIYAQWFGAKVTEIPTQHFARTTGQTKYGLNRTIKVLLDLMVVQFLQRYLTKPIYIFGGFGFLCFLGSFFSFGYATYLKFAENTSYIQTPLLLLAVMMGVVGFLSLFIGIVSEILMRTYYESQDRKPYHVRTILNEESLKETPKKEAA